jgi:hypothetical protein
VKGIVLSFLLVFSNWALAFFPNATINFLQKPPTFLYFNEVIRIPVQVKYIDLALLLQWTLPTGVSLEIVSGVCPSIPVTYAWMGTGSCTMNLVIRGSQLGQSIAGRLTLYFSGKTKRFRWYNIRTSPAFSLQVIPHCPSMLNIPLQHATANQSFILNLKSYIKYYDENTKGKTPAQPVVIPGVQDGISYDLQQQAIIGKPTRLGIYSFTIGAKNTRCTAQSVQVNIQVTANIKDKPIFKTNTSMSAGIPKQKYTMNLLELLQPKASFMVNNQIQFRIQPNLNNPTWLHISPTDATKLEGVTPESSAGQTVKVTLIASSNTGGDSEPLTVSIPITFDQSKQPKLAPFALELLAGHPLSYDITPYVSNPSSEPFELFIDKVEPLAPWLQHTKTALHGVVPLDAIGKLYQLTLHTSTSIGGSSNPITVPLHVVIDKEKTPHFNSSISLPIALTEHAYLYDFQSNHDVSPEDIPFQIELAPGYPTPGWLEIHNNQLISKKVPDISDSEVIIYVVLKNIPGGQSTVKELYLKLFNSTAAKD